MGETCYSEFFPFEHKVCRAIIDIRHDIFIRMGYISPVYGEILKYSNNFVAFQLITVFLRFYIVNIPYNALKTRFNLVYRIFDKCNFT